MSTYLWGTINYYILLLSVFCFLNTFKAVTYAEPSAKMSQSGPEGPEQSVLSEIEGMVFVKGGCFDMGDLSGEGDGDERPLHRTCVDDFYIGRYEVTQREWIKVMGNNPSFFINCDDCPVENVSYNDIKEFIRRLNRGTVLKYRLPTEAEWEYAARSGGKKEMWAGISSGDELDDYAWHKGNSAGRTHPVGQKKGNGLGLYDMSGNVQEGGSDWYEGDYYNISPKNNPGGPSGGQYRVDRGGSWINRPWGIRTSIRYRLTQDDRGREFGFRLAVSPM